MKKVFSVTELSGQIKHLLEESFDLFWVEGEISNLHRPASGHVYFTLKDENSQIRAVIFRSAIGGRSFLRAGMLFELENGMKIVCRARLSVYQPRGDYQLLIDNIEPMGIGALQKAFEQLKARLEAEGLFDAAHKQTLPMLPRRIGVITSPTGAVIRDILNVTRRRFAAVDILIAPVRVQGSEAAGDIIRAIADLHTYGDSEVIILARGGGSLEDLAAFNNEGVARAIFQARIPIVSAVGHETDFTIADFVADLRAPTPSAAAELVVPVQIGLAASVGAWRSRMINLQASLLERRREQVFYLAGRLQSPRRMIGDMRLTVGAGLNRMQSVINQALTWQQQRMDRAAWRLRHTSPLAQIGKARGILVSLRKDIIAAVAAIVAEKKQ
ncbi:MAG: exodeoxyribonuclease VII large subunit, partial [Deltaproteobacteria bacterium]|nr:exodeoxyribonuclease VII large subunit [Deltaproteobacteria bacterium]